MPLWWPICLAHSNPGFAEREEAMMTLERLHELKAKAIEAQRYKDGMLMQNVAGRSVADIVQIDLRSLEAYRQLASAEMEYQTALLQYQKEHTPHDV